MLKTIGNLVITDKKTISAAMYGAKKTGYTKGQFAGMAMMTAAAGIVLGANKLVGKWYAKAEIEVYKEDAVDETNYKECEEEENLE